MSATQIELPAAFGTLWQCDTCNARFNTQSKAATCCTDNVPDANLPPGVYGLAEISGIPVQDVPEHSPRTLSSHSDCYPEDRVDEQQWISWKLKYDNGKPRKVPRAPWEYPESPHRPIDAQDPQHWTAFETAADWVTKLAGFELGYSIPDPDKELGRTDMVLLDFDDARDPETETVHPVAAELISIASTYADVSPSGTGLHALGRGDLPAGVTSITAELPPHPAFPGAELEIYPAKRFVTMTGQHIEDTPRETQDCSALLRALAEACVVESTAKATSSVSEPDKTREDLADIDVTTDIQDVFDAIHHIGPDDIRLRSTVTETRNNGESLDPAFPGVNSDSGTRLWQDDDGWVYRKGHFALDALQVVAWEEGIIDGPEQYPSGKQFFDAVEALRERGAHIPEYQSIGEVDPDSLAPGDNAYFEVNLRSIADIEDVISSNTDLMEDRAALLKTCLYARDKYTDGSLDDETPPFDALIATAQLLDVSNPEEMQPGDPDYMQAFAAYEALNPSDISL